VSGPIVAGNMVYNYSQELGAAYLHERLELGAVKGPAIFGGHVTRHGGHLRLSLRNLKSKLRGRCCEAARRWGIQKVRPNSCRGGAIGAERTKKRSHALGSCHYERNRTEQKGKITLINIHVNR
jgi:hypothetical protein